MILPSVLPSVRLRAPVGFHRFEPVDGRDHSRPGQCDLPDKEFRYLRTVRLIVTPDRGDQGLGHFCRALHVAMQTGLYHREFITRVWRVVSEDSAGLLTRSLSC